MEFLERALDAHSGGVLRNPEGRPYLLEASSLEETQHHRRPVFLVQFIHDIVEHRRHNWSAGSGLSSSFMVQASCSRRRRRSSPRRTLALTRRTQV